ncbi:MAG TPA: hypothetical protein VMW79_09160 [Anaerolineae bacterium]|nr:hypothetical protein [Anaerolineae bacterium]
MGVELAVLVGVGLCVQVAEAVGVCAGSGERVTVSSIVGVPSTSGVGVMGIGVKVGTMPKVGEGTAVVSAEADG